MTVARPTGDQPTDGELEILKVLWRSGPAGLGQICNQLRQDRQVATTTVATMLKVMLEKRLVRRTGGPRGYRWSAARSERATHKRLLQRFVDRVFDGSAHRLVAHLLNDTSLSDEDRDEIRRMLKASRKPDRG